MTKRVFLVLLCLSLLFLAGCTDGLPISELPAFLQGESTSAPLLSPLDWTPENLKLLDVLGNNRKHDHHLFNFTAPEGTQHVSIMQWVLKDGQWIVFEGDNLALTDAKGCIALSWDQLCNDANVVLRTAEATYAISHENPEDFSVSGRQTVTIFQSMDVEIVLEQEIPLLMQIVTNAEEPPVLPLECWQEPERYTAHEQVTLVTVSFSAKPLDTKAFQP